jgi:hypothetical protein
MGEWSASFSLALKYISAWPANFPPLMFVNLTLLGGALGILYARGKSLWLPICLHAGIVAAAVPVVSILAPLGISHVALIASPQTTAVVGMWIIVVLLWRSPQNR